MAQSQLSQLILKLIELNSWLLASSELCRQTVAPERPTPISPQAVGEKKQARTRKANSRESRGSEDKNKKKQEKKKRKRGGKRGEEDKRTREEEERREEARTKQERRTVGVSQGTLLDELFFSITEFLLQRGKLLLQLQDLSSTSC